MTGVYACLFEAVCDVTTVPSHLNRTESKTYAIETPMELTHNLRLRLFRFCQSFTSNFPFSFSFPFLLLFLSLSLRPFVCARKLLTLPSIFFFLYCSTCVGAFPVSVSQSRTMNVGKYQNGTSYTRVSARQKWTRLVLFGTHWLKAAGRAGDRHLEKLRIDLFHRERLQSRGVKPENSADEACFHFLHFSMDYENYSRHRMGSGSKGEFEEKNM